MLNSKLSPINPLFIINLIFNYLVKFIKIAFHYLFDSRLNTTTEFYPCHSLGEFEPRSKFGYRFFLISNRFHNIGFGFEYRGLYYFSNAHFSSKNKIHIDNKEIELYQLGLSFLCSSKFHNLVEPKDEQDLYLINPYMPSIKGKCIYKHPFYYSYFPINPVYREFTGLPIVNFQGELVSIYDNFRKIQDNIYNILGEFHLWKERDKQLEQYSNINNLYLKVLKSEDYNIVIYEINFNNKKIGHFFKYKNTYYISSVFINEKGFLNLRIPDDDEINNKVFAKLFRNWCYYSEDSDHNITFAENDLEIYLLDSNFNKCKLYKGIIRFERDSKVWIDSEGSPLWNFIGLPIINKHKEVLGIYGDFKAFNRIGKTGYSILLGDLNLYKNHSLKLVLSNPNSLNNVLEIRYDLKIIEQIAFMCLDKENNKFLDRVLFGINNNVKAENIKNTLLDIVEDDSEIFLMSDLTLKYTQVENKKFLITSVDWIGYSYLNSKDEFPFNNPKSLLIIFQDESTILTQELLIRYYKSSPIHKRGYFFKMLNSESIQE